MESNKHEYTKTNTFKIMLLVVGMLLVLVLLGLWLQKNFFHTVADIQADVYPTTLTVGDTLFYTDKSSFSAIKE